MSRQLIKSPTVSAPFPRLVLGRSTCDHVLVMSLLVLVLLMLSEHALSSPVDFKAQSIRISMLQEPPSLDSSKSTDLVSFFILGHTTEGLLRYDRRGKLVAGVAESWDVTPTKLTFKLRPEARWHDGSKVTAADFIYAWQNVNDPSVAAPFAAIMHPIKNARAIQNGELPVEALGVSSPSEGTLEVALERPCGYCLGLMAHATFYPINKAFHDQAGEGYGSESDQLLSNGPFVLTEWVHEARLVMSKNPYYWDQESIHLNEIEVAYITGDNRTRLNLFRDGQIAFVRMGSETVKDAVSQGMRIRTFLTGGVSYVWFNFREGKPTRNKALRQAIQASFNPDEYVNKVIAIPGYKPTDTLFPSWIKGNEKSFGNEYPPPKVIRGKQRRQELMEQVALEMGEVPDLTILTVSSTTGAKAAEYFQGLLEQSLGITARVDQQTFKQYLSKARRGEFDLVLSSWYPDFDDLVTYADLLGSANPNNRGRFRSEEYDRSLSVLLENVNPLERFKAAAELQRIIVQEVPVLPNAETSSAYMVHPKLKGVARRVFGQDPDFTYARVVE
jgi:oligopeptide transport system substrate-binding protein